MPNPGAIIVVGGTGMIGQAVVLEFASRGYPVLFTGRKSGGEKLASELADKAKAMSTAQQSASTFPPVVQFFRAGLEAQTPLDEAVSQAATLGGNGGLAHAINVAGTVFEEGDVVAPTWKHSETTWQHFIDTNIMGVIRACNAEMRQFEKQGRQDFDQGSAPYSIVNTASIFGHRALPLGAPYAMTKAAVISLTQSLGHEAHRYGVRVNSISPGFHLTESMSALPAEYLATRLGPTGHGGDFSALAKSYHHLAVEAKYAVGSDMAVDGGWLSGGPGSGLDQWIEMQSEGQGTATREVQ